MSRGKVAEKTIFTSQPHGVAVSALATTAHSPRKCYSSTTLDSVLYLHPALLHQGGAGVVLHLQVELHSPCVFPGLLPLPGLLQQTLRATETHASAATLHLTLDISDPFPDRSRLPSTSHSDRHSSFLSFAPRCCYKLTESPSWTSPSRTPPAAVTACWADTPYRSGWRRSTCLHPGKHRRRRRRRRHAG